MRNIFNFIWKNNFFFLFLILEIFAFTLVVQNNNYQKAAFINKTNNFFASINKKINGIYDYFHLAEINKQLSEENARLREKELVSFNITDNKIYTVNDTNYKQEFKYIECKIINSSINRRKNYLTLNKGSNHGIKKDMGVISPDGIVGIVTDVSPFYATVMSILHIDSKVSIKMKNSEHIGSLVWEGANYRKGNLNYVPTHIVMNPGDTVITSGFSSIFPEGINVGYIIDYDLKSGEIFYDVNILFAVDYNKISNVYVVNNILKEERNKLEKKITND